MTHGSRVGQPRMAWLVLCAIVLMAALSLRTPLDHDEGQYIAAADLVARGLLPYRDFPYLQTPLQPILFAPIAWLASGWTLIGLRLVNTICIAVAILLIGRTASALAKDERAGVAAMLLALVTDSVLYAGSVARNDALPFLFLAAALERLYAAPGPMRAGRSFIAGLLAAAAASAKISYALPAAAIVAQAIWWGRTPANRRAMLALLAGSLAGALPTLYFALLAPRPFLFQTYTYATVAVRAWAALNGGSWRLTVPFRILEWTGNMLQGPLLVMLVMGIAMRWRAAKPAELDRLPFALGPVVAAAALASALPMPALRQYLTPLVPPLIAWFIALTWPRRHQWSRRRSAMLFALVAIAGLAGSAVLLIRPGEEEEPLRVEQDAHLIGRIARHAGAASIATLEPVHAVDSGIGLDPRFATGHFLFRAMNVPECADPALCPVTAASIERLDARPPGAILTGTQHKHPATIPGGLDGQLDKWAADHRYRAVTINRKNLLWLPSGRNHTPRP